VPNGRCHRASHPGGGSHSSPCTTVLITGVFDRGRIKERNYFSHSCTSNWFKLSNSDGVVITWLAVMIPNGKPVAVGNLKQPVLPYITARDPDRSAAHSCMSRRTHTLHQLTKSQIAQLKGVPLIRSPHTLQSCLRLSTVS